MASRIPRTVVHHSRFDPRRATGGVETFARNLELVFEKVEYSTPETLDVERVRREKLPVICDNQHVLDWPEEVPVIGFQHGVAAKKLWSAPSIDQARMVLRQRRAAKRPNTLWVACARWISRTFEQKHGRPADFIVYHAVNVERFDGVRPAVDPKLVLHDARTAHKGKHLVERLARRIPEFKFEPLSCKPEEVPDRMRRGAAFLHLSRYEGNSIVCNEAMAMNLPCFFTQVGLMLDGAEQFDVRTISARDAFHRSRRLEEAVRGFLHEVESGRHFEPRRWTLDHASPELNRKAWSDVLEGFDARARW